MDLEKVNQIIAYLILLYMCVAALYTILYLNRGFRLKEVAEDSGKPQWWVLWMLFCVLLAKWPLDFVRDVQFNLRKLKHDPKKTAD